MADYEVRISCFVRRLDVKIDAFLKVSHVARREQSLCSVMISRFNNLFLSFAYSFRFRRLLTCGPESGHLTSRWVGFLSLECVTW
jgi:hypothetical protein